MIMAPERERVVVCETARLVPITEIASSPDISNELRIRVTLVENVCASFAKGTSLHAGDLHYPKLYFCIPSLFFLL